MSKDFDKRDFSGSSDGFGLDASETRALFLEAVEKKHGDLLTRIYSDIKKEAMSGNAEYMMYLNHPPTTFQPLRDRRTGANIMFHLQSKGYKIKYTWDGRGFSHILIQWPDPTLNSVEEQK